MKNKNIQNNNGISVCDSIIMSVKTKRTNFRKPFSVFIAAAGFAAVILSFFGMFELSFDKGRIFIASCGLSLFYILLTVIEGKALWIYAGSAVVYLGALYKKIAVITEGFKYIYNIIYKVSFHSKINYYKNLSPQLEEESVTTFLFFYVWLLAIVIYFFTIARPNPILPLLVTFPVIEIGLYNGIELPVFRGMTVVAYWLSLLAMCTIDVGEYSGGQSGFVRKDNLFFPKRHMKLKVTERCGAYIMGCIMAVTLVTMFVLKVTDYKRSDEINKKRKAIAEAFNSFSIDNLAESLTDLSSAFGFEFRFESHKLGSFDHISYKNVTDLTVNVSSKPDVALYLKDYAGSVYKDNEWFDLPETAYTDPRLTECDEYGINPQIFPVTFSTLLYDENGVLNSSNINITSHLKHKKLFIPYCFQTTGGIKPENDKFFKLNNNETKSIDYQFIPLTAEKIAPFIGSVQRASYSAGLIQDSAWRDKVSQFCDTHSLYTYDDFFPLDFELAAPDDFLYSTGYPLMAELLENQYSTFVYDNYLDVPDNSAMQEVREAYSEIFDSYSTSTANDKLELLKALREKMTSSTQYSLKPGKTPSNRDFVNYFLLENQKGYCTHFASSGVILARMAGIPARYATGYVIVGDDFNDKSKNSDGTYTIDIKDNRSHAWAEVYIDGFGWVPFEFTAGYSNSTINTSPVTTTSPVTSTTTSVSAANGTSTTSGKNTSHSASKKPKQSTSTTSATTKPGGFGFGNDNGGKSRAKLSAVAAELLRWLLIAALTVVIIIIRRLVSLKRREKRFTGGKSGDRIASMYAYAIKLLEYKKIENINSKFTEFADDVEKMIGGIYFDENSFRTLTDIALRSKFGNSKPTADELKQCGNTVRKLAETIYSKSSFFGKLYIKFIANMI